MTPHGPVDPTQRGPAGSVRDLRRDDGKALDTVFAGLSEHSRYLRFHAAVATLSSTRRALLDVDQREHVALLAEVANQPIAVARFIRDLDNPTVAETANAVSDRWHRRGVGRYLMQHLARRASLAGITRPTAAVLPWNRPALALFRNVFPHRFDHHDGAVISWR
jgi:GNAT superfamily N-acetyltransferase